MILSVEEVTSLLKQPSGRSSKEIRDKAMLELLYATGIRVSELTSLKLTDINMNIGFITCRDGGKDRTIPFSRVAKGAMEDYIAVSYTHLYWGVISILDSLVQMLRLSITAV